MARIIFVSGGCRSGKSRFALEQASLQPGIRTFIATCPKIDAEMNQRILKHQMERQVLSQSSPAWKTLPWKTLEEETDLLRAFHTLSQNPFEQVVIVDCLTLWVNNLLYHRNQGTPGILARDESRFTESDLKSLCQEILDEVSQTLIGSVYFVSSEVGLGLVPETSEARLYRDLLGTCNQCFAQKADEAYFLVSGIPIPLKSVE